jgi:hypothetical protein
MTTKLKTSLSELSPKHLQALDLIRSHTLSYRQIAKIVGWSEDYLQTLIAGDTSKCGSSATLFAAEVDKIDAETQKEIKHLTREVKQSILCVFDDYTKSCKGAKVTEDTRKEMVSIMNALAKVTPNVEIGSFSYTKGLSVEDLYNEFKRLKGSGLDGRGVSPTFQTRTRALPGTEELRDTTP